MEILEPKNKSNTKLKECTQWQKWRGQRDKQ